jgi:hypothetical protein
MSLQLLLMISRQAGDALLCTSPEAHLSRYKVKVEVTTQQIGFAEVKFKLQMIRLKAMKCREERAVIFL